MNKECLVGALHKDAPILSLSLVHTARRLIRLVILASSSDALSSTAALRGVAGRAAEVVRA